MPGLDMSALYALFQVTMIDLVLAGDNAIVIGMAAAGLDPHLRRKAIFIGILAATVLRIGFALVATQILELTGLLLAGGILLLWVCWKMWQELIVSDREKGESLEAIEDVDLNADGRVSALPSGKTLRQAVLQIILADVSMSLDNVLAVAGAAYEHVGALVFGLSLSVLLMGIASSFIAGLLNRMRWIAWLGLIVILYVAVNMIFDGMDDVTHGAMPYIPLLKG